MTFVVASNNDKKVEEIERILASIGHTAVSAKQLGILLEPEETANSFYGNATIKALAFFEHTEMPVIADDSGLMVEALGGAPGVMTARYSGPNSTNDSNISKLLKELESIELQDRTAWFVSAIVLVMPDNRIISALGYTRGFIGYEKRGENGFGYDPIFYIEGNRSYAELSDMQKNSISHRGRALRKIAFKLRNIYRVKGRL